MKITKLNIKNFRLLKEFSLELEDELSVIIGKNNSGKTSILTALNKFLNQSASSITLDDFNIDLKNQIIKLMSNQEKLPDETGYTHLGIELKIYIEYFDEDSLAQVKDLIMSLDPDDNNIVLKFEYALNYQSLCDLVADFKEENEKYDGKPELYLKDNFHKYFGSIRKKSLLHSNESVFIDLTKENINLSNVISFDFISAKRSVTNKESDKTLSYQTAKIYKKLDESDEQLQASDKFKRALRNTDSELDGIYSDLFKGVLEKVGKFGGISPNDTKLKVASTLQHQDLLDGNTTVMYSHKQQELPEHYNGLGYMNLISMIFDIEMVMAKFRRPLDKLPAAVNLFFIEEPEAHTHPQMQYIFIKNIKELLDSNLERDDGIKIQLQTALTTHSSHIVSECDFDDIKFLRKCAAENNVKSKNLKALANEYSSTDEAEKIHLEQAFKFLKQYLTLNRAELFFADKAIFIEGDTERILLPAMMKKVDQERGNSKIAPLLSQNISLIEVGAYSQTFEKFVDFIGLKTLVITDIDSQYKDGNNEVVKCVPSDSLAEKTSNSSLKFFFGSDDINFYKNLNLKDKTLIKHNGSWQQDATGNFLIVYQTEELDYHARSFEDAFFSLNKGFLGTEHQRFLSLTKKHYKAYVDFPSASPFEFAENAVNSKPSLAIEILMNSTSNNLGGQKVEFSNWEVPAYIKEGLKWLSNN